MRSAAPLPNVRRVWNRDANCRRNLRECRFNEQGLNLFLRTLPHLTNLAKMNATIASSPGHGGVWCLYGAPALVDYGK